MAGRPFLIGGAVLTALRKALDLKAYQLAERAGITNGVLSQYEVGDKTPSPEQLARLLEPLGCTAEEFADLVAEHEQLAAGSPQEPAGGIDPTAEERRFIRRGGRQARRLVEAELTRRLRHRKVRRARRRAVVFVRRLRALPAAERPGAVAADPDYQGWSIVERLCLESKAAAAGSADQALELAELALLVAEHPVPEGPFRLRTAGYAWAFVGNARRVRNDLDEAKQAFVNSARLWREGAKIDPFPLEEWRILSLEASLRIDIQELPRALEFLESALAQAPRGETGSLLLMKARVFEQQRSFELALALMAQAEPLLDEEREPRHLWVLQFNRTTSLCHLGRFTEAENLLPSVRARAIALRQELDLVRTLWLEGRTEIGLGRTEEGHAALTQVAAEFRAREMAYDGALVNLELSVVELDQGRSAQVRQRAVEMWWIFRAGGLHREALAALELFCQAARQEAATAELARRVQEYLERAQNNPALRFQR